MIKQKFLFLLAALVLLLHQVPVSYAMKQEKAEKGSIAKKSAQKVSSSSTEEEDSNEAEELVADNRPPLTLIKEEIKPGFFYRTSDYKEATAVYAKQVLYYDEDLFNDTQHMQSFVDNKGTDDQYLGVVFFGVWSYPNEDLELNKNLKEIIEAIEVPIRKVKNDQMFHKNDENKLRYHSRVIWKTGYQGRDIQEESHHYNIMPCRGAHTEVKFKMFIADSKNKKALWEYFFHESNNQIKHQNKKLDLVGFKFYSTNDACDVCFDELLQMQSNPDEILEDFLPKNVQENRRIPFQILFHSKIFYHPKNDYEDESGSSLFFYPKEIKPLIRLYGYNSERGSYACRAISNGTTTEEEIYHQETVTFRENQQLNYIFLKRNQGESRKVTLTLH